MQQYNRGEYFIVTSDTAQNSKAAKSDAKPRSKMSALLGVAGSLLFVAIVLVLLVHFGVHKEVLHLLQWFKQQGAWAPVLFMLIMAAVVVLLLPGALFTVGAGFVFGVVAGSVYVLLGTTLGAVLAFLIARYCFGQRAREFVMARAKLKLVNDELTPNGWKIVLLTRLIPFFPGKISNYFFGLTQFSLRGYIGGSLLGFIPFTVHNVYLGSLIADISSFDFTSRERSIWEWGLYAGGLLAAIAVIIYLNRLASRALAQYTEQDT
jgi:uncharacterized membrane protein YdjX (TVP38/TMEM64 family)